MTDEVTIKTAEKLTPAFYKQLQKHGYPDLALVQATAGLQRRHDVKNVIPVLFSRLRGRPLYYQQAIEVAGATLTNEEIVVGFQRLDQLLDEQAPHLKGEFFSRNHQRDSDALHNLKTAFVKESADWSNLTNSVQDWSAWAWLNDLCHSLLDADFTTLAKASEVPKYTIICPFPGLKAFGVQTQGEEETSKDYTGHFFGRDALVDRLVTLLEEDSVMVALGPSGSGKSSVIMAGVVPKLKENGNHCGYLTPTDNPLAQLKIVLEDKPNVIIVDQFEEVFTHIHEHQENKRTDFINQLVAWVEQADIQNKLILTMRIDFMSECLAYERLTDWVYEHSLIIRPLTSIELRDVASQQAASAIPDVQQGNIQPLGLKFEPGLLTTILNDLKNERAAMPLLQFALRELWKQRNGRWLRTEAYRELGGIKEAIAKAVDTVYNSLEDEGEKQLMKYIFIRLTRIDETGVRGHLRRYTRQRVALKELIPKGKTQSQVETFIAQLSGLLVIHHEATDMIDEVDQIARSIGTSRTVKVEVIHEAVIQHWKQLHKWIDEDYDKLRLRQKIVQEAFEWEQETNILEKDSLLLLHGIRLQEVKAAQFEQNATINAYVAACDVKELTQKIMLLIPKTKAAVTDDKPFEAYKLGIEGVNMTYKPYGMVVDIAENALHHALFKFSQPTLLSIHNGAVLSAVFNHDGSRILTISDDHTAYLWDGNGKFITSLGGYVESVPSADFNQDGSRILTNFDDTAYLWDRDGKLIASLGEHKGQLILATFNQDGNRILTTSENHTVHLWDRDGKFILSFEENKELVQSAAFNHDGSRILTASEDKTARLWDGSGNLIKSLTGHKDQVQSVVFNHDGSRILTASSDNTARVWDENGHLIKTLTGHEAPVQSAVFNHDGSRILTTSVDYTARLWDGDGNLIQLCGGYTEPVQSAVFNHDGSRILIVIAGSARLWDQDGIFIAFLKEHDGDINSTDFTDKSKLVASRKEYEASIRLAVFNHDGSRILTASEDNITRLWDRDGKFIVSLEGHKEPVRLANFNHNGNRILTASFDNTARLWDRNGHLIKTLSGHRGPLVSADLNHDGSRILTASEDNTACLWDEDSKLIASLEGHQGAVRSARFNHDGSRILTASEDRTARLWDGSGNLIKSLAGHKDSVQSACFNHNGSRILTASEDRTARLWDQDGKFITSLEGHEGSIWSACFNHDGSRILTASEDNTARLWDGNGHLVKLLVGHKGRVWSALFNHDTSRILTASHDNTVRLWDRDGNFIMSLEEHKSQLWSAVFNHDGSRILTASEDNTACLWDENGNLIKSLVGHKGSVWSAVFNHDGSRILTASEDRTARLWDGNGNLIAIVEGHQGSVKSAVFNRDGSRILTASFDSTACLWICYHDIDLMLAEAERQLLLLDKLDG